MKRAPLLLVALLLALPAEAAPLAAYLASPMTDPPSESTGLPDTEAMPPVLYDRVENKPTWVALDVALTPSGEVREQWLPGPTPWLLRQAIEDRSPSIGCRQLNTSYHMGDWTHRTDLSATARAAALVLMGRVTGLAPGMLPSDGAAGTLFRVSVDESLKGDRGAGDGEYFFLPLGRLRVGGQEICLRHVGLPYYGPEVGDRVILFVDDPSSATRGYLNVGGAGGIITIRADGTVLLPRFHSVSRQGQQLSVEDLLISLRSILGGER